MREQVVQDCVLSGPHPGLLRRVYSVLTHGIGGTPTTALATGDARGVISNLKAACTPPRELLALVRWLFLLFSLFTLVLTGTLLSELQLDMSGLRQAIAGGAVVVIGWQWIRGYKRGGFPLLWHAPEGLALLLLGVSLGDPSKGIGLLYTSLCFRSLYGAWHRVLVVTLTYLLAYLGWMTLGTEWANGPAMSVQMLYPTPGFAVTAAMLYLLAAALRRHERAVARERALRRADATLVAAVDREAIYAAAFEAVYDLLQNPETPMGLIVPAGEEMLVRIANGAGRLATTGATVPCAELPDPVRLCLDQRRAVQVQGPKATRARECLGLAGATTAGSMLVLPLLSQAVTRGALVVSSDASLPEDSRLDLESLAAALVLALESAAAVEDMHMRQSERRFRSLVQNSSDVITVVGPDTTIHYQTPSVERMLHVDATELTGAKLIDLVHPDDVARVRTTIREAVSRQGVVAPVEWRLRRRDGSAVYVEAIVSNLLDDPDVRGLVVNTRDISERKAMERQMAYQAFHDPLTGLANRALFIDRADHAVARRDRHNKPVAVLFMDLDNFKTINDSLGHAAGDQLLVGVTERLKSSLRPADTAARLSGDEFAVLLEDMTQTSDAINVAQRLTEALQEPFTVQGKEVFVGASMGIAISTSTEESAEELLSNADIAMYTAKNDGKGRYAVFQPSMHAAILNRMELEADLRRAIQSHQFIVHYQPIVDIGAGGKIIGVEALVRWMHPKRGLVAPLDFIPLAEETGLIVPIDQWVLQEACREARQWQLQYPDQPLTITVNVSPCQLRRPRLVAEVAEILRASQLDPQRLCLEITESAIIQDMEGTIEKLHGLKALGVQLAIDDFGTGYSSLSYLRRFPVDILKIDRSFVTGVSEELQDLDLTAAIVALGRTLRLRTVAEGIERSEQLDQLKKLGCDLGQGFYFARPLDSDGMSMLLYCASIDGGRLAS